MQKTAKYWLDKILGLNITEPVRIMNVCGGHERTLSHSGVRSLLPENIQIIPGPGCPVCVCDNETIQFAISLALEPHIAIITFGDMLRVPTNIGRTKINSLEQARAHGGTVIPISSPQEAIAYANNHNDQEVVFFAAGFETTSAPIAAMIEQGLPDNLSLLLALKRTWPIVHELLKSEDSRIDGLIAPGHVATIMGSNEWNFVNAEFSLPCAIGGFTDTSLLAAIYSVVKQKITHNINLENCYNIVVQKNGNSRAKSIISSYFDISDANWRGVGVIPKSGYELKQSYSHIDANKKHQQLKPESTQNDQMPPGCDCSAVILGKLSPLECKLYETACTPATPIGPCMVSDEGACHIWWLSGQRKKHECDA